jgi:hypothetical protein
VDLASALGVPSGRLGETVLRAVMQAWREPQIGFGHLLAAEVDRLIVFDAPPTPTQEAARQNAVTQLESFKSELRGLDA